MTARDRHAKALELMDQLEDVARWLDQWDKFPDFGSNKRAPGAEAEARIYDALGSLSASLRSGIDEVRKAIDKGHDDLPPYGNNYW